MPDMVLLVANPNFKPTTPEEKSAWALIKSKPPMQLDHTTAEENARLSRGMYMIDYGVKAPDEGPIPLEKRTNAELKEMMLAQGIKTEKQMKRSQIIHLLRNKLDGIEIVDDEVDVGDSDAPGEQ